MRGFHGEVSVILEGEGFQEEEVMSLEADSEAVALGRWLSMAIAKERRH